MWYNIGKWVVKNRFFSIITLSLITIFFAFKATQVQMSYEFNKSIPTDSKIYKDFVFFQQKFGGDADLVVVGVQDPQFFTVKNFEAISQLQANLKTEPAVKGITSVTDAIHLVKNDSAQKFVAQKIFTTPFIQANIDSGKNILQSIPLYNGLLYNPATNSYLIGISINKDSTNHFARTRIINQITQHIKTFEKQAGLTTYISGLPYIRTKVSDRIKAEMNYFLIGSLLLSAIVLLLFFRSVTAMLLSLTVVIMGVIWSFGLMALFGYKITLLTALIAPLVVVIGVPNCIYFLTKYHSVYETNNDKLFSLYTMVGKMGVVTLFCNIAAAVGFAVFALTESRLLKEFGVVSGIVIFALFFISLLFIPAVLSYLKPPTAKQMAYLHNQYLHTALNKIQYWVNDKRAAVITVTAIVLAVACVGIFKIKRKAFIVDDLPKKDVIYTHLKWFEQNFHGVMPLEILIDTKKKKGLLRTLKPIENIETLSGYFAQNVNTSKALSFVEGLKIARQAFYDGDTASYTIPSGMAELVLMSDYMKPNNDSSVNKKTTGSSFEKLLNNFIDSNKQIARLSINMKDIGTEALPLLVHDIRQKTDSIFDKSVYDVTITGSSVTFLEGSNFIINGLKESIIYAFLLIAACMLYLFRSGKILLYSIIPNIIPLLITAGVMGWCGIALKPSTVLVFSVALGIVIDVTIRFLVNYKQELTHYNQNVNKTINATIQHTGISIIYTSLVLIAGFVIFCFSSFGGTQALGWLTSLTLFTGTLTNLILLPALMRKKKEK